MKVSDEFRERLQSLVESSDFRKSLEILESNLADAAQDEASKMELLIWKSYVLLHLSDIHKARETFESATSSLIRDARIGVLAAYVDALLDYAEGKPGPAAAKFNALLRTYSDEAKRPENRAMYYSWLIHYAWALLSSGDQERAVPVLEQLLKLPIGAAERSEALCQLATAYLEQKRFSEAEQLLRDAIRTGIAPKWNGSVQYGLGKCYLARRDFRGALEMFHEAKAILNDPENSVAIEKWITFTKENAPDSLQDFSRQ